MPAVIVDPENLAESPAGGPVIAGIQFRRPTSRSETREPLRATVELAEGSLRSFDRGVRPVYAFTWANLTEDEVEALKVVTAAPFVPLQLESGAPVVIVATDDGLDVDAVAGTFPVRYGVSTTLKGRDPIR